MSSKKITGVTDFPMPRKTTELRSFLGLTNYFRDHVPNHSNVVAPLHKMIDHAAKKQTLLVWTDCSLIASLGGYNVSRLTRYNRYNTPRFQF